MSVAVHSKNRIHFRFGYTKEFRDGTVPYHVVENGDAIYITKWAIAYLDPFGRQ
jgi:hypothetical protein